MALTKESRTLGDGEVCEKREGGRRKGWQVHSSGGPYLTACSLKSTFDRTHHGTVNDPPCSLNHRRDIGIKFPGGTRCAGALVAIRSATRADRSGDAIRSLQLRGKSLGVRAAGCIVVSGFSLVPATRDRPSMSARASDAHALHTRGPGNPSDDHREIEPSSASFQASNLFQTYRIVSLALRHSGRIMSAVIPRLTRWPFLGPRYRRFVWQRAR